MTAPEKSFSVTGPSDRRPFVWTDRDVTAARFVAFALGLARSVEHGEAVMESANDMRANPPRITDAWRFFHAARVLAHDSVQAATAREIGARIAMYVTGWFCIDVNKIECGAAVDFAVTVAPQLAHVGRPIPWPPRDVRYVLTSDGHAVVLAGGGE